MVAYQVEKRSVSDKTSGAVDGMPMPQWLFLMYEVNTAAIFRSFLRIWSFISRPDYEADFLYSGSQNLFNEDAQNGFLGPITVVECLEGQSSLAPTSGSDYSSCDLHESLPFILPYP
jgi:hypothetical protein